MPVRDPPSYRTPHPGLGIKRTPDPETHGGPGKANRNCIARQAASCRVLEKHFRPSLSRPRLAGGSRSTVGHASLEVSPWPPTLRRPNLVAHLRLFESPRSSRHCELPCYGARSLPRRYARPSADDSRAQTCALAAGWPTVAFPSCDLASKRGMWFVGVVR